MCKKTTIYKNLTHGDWVICTNCGKMMLVPCGADQCPECTCEGSLQWVDEEKQEADIDEVGETEYKDKELELQDYISVDTLAIEYPDEYKRLQGENNLDDVESPEADVKEFANEFGNEALGKALIQLINNGDFIPDYEFSQALWELQTMIEQ